MTPRPTPETERILNLIPGGCSCDPQAIADDLRPQLEQLERERDEAREALSGRTVSCSQCNKAAEGIQSMREAIKEASLQVSAFLGFYSDSLTLPQMRSLSECINKLQSFLTESKQHEQTKHQH